MERESHFSRGSLDSRRDSYLTLFILFLTLLSGTLFYLLRFLEPVHPYPPFSREVTIERGISTSQIASLLEKEGIIHNAYFFSLVVRLSKMDPYLQAGSYVFRSDMSLLEIVKRLSTGMVVTDSITIPEGFTIMDIGQIFQEKLNITQEAFYLALDRVLMSYPSVIQEYKVAPHYHYLEGYLFPDTYLFGRKTEADTIIASMVDRFWYMVRRYTIEARANELGLSLHEVITIASMIEREAKKEEERPLISGVIHNRLRKGMLLQIDATILYVLPTKKDVVLYQDLQVDSPYNSYQVNSLPPGPISNPGLPSLLAAIYPERTDFIYYVARRDGSHIFSRTYQEHLQAIQESSRGR